MHAHGRSPDDLLAAIVDYATGPTAAGPGEIDAARTCFLDALASGFVALKDPECTRLIGPVVRGATTNGGARIPGTSYELDPVKAAFDLGVLLRCADARGPHPADTFGGLLAIADWRSRRAAAEGGRTSTVRDFLDAAIRAFELHHGLAASNPLGARGFDDATYVRVATAAVGVSLLGGSRAQALAATAHAFADGAALRLAEANALAAFRDRWATADAAARGVRLALLIAHGAARSADESHPATATGGRGVPLEAGVCEAAANESAAIGFAAIETACAFEASVVGRPFTLDRPFGVGAIEALPFGLRAELQPTIVARFPARQAQAIVDLFSDPARIDAMPVHEFVSALVKSG